MLRSVVPFTDATPHFRYSSLTPNNFDLHDFCKGGLTMRSYAAARGLFSFLALLAWCAIIGGVLIAVAAGEIAVEMRSFGGPPPELVALVASLPGLAMVFVGFLGLAIVQNGRATVDTAELTQQMLKVARDQLEVSQQALKRNDLVGRSFKAIAPETDEASRVGFSGKYSANQTDRKDQASPPAPSAVELRKIEGNGWTYGEKTITKEKSLYFVDGVPFPSLDDARRYILKNPVSEV